MNTNTNTITPESVTMMFSDRVKLGKTKEYEQWIQNINKDAKTFEGFIEVNILKPASTNSPEYITLLKFSTQDDMIRWKESPNHAKWLGQLPGLVEESADMQQASGVEMWFNRPKVLISADPPPFWKQVVLGVITVYPMILILNFLLKPITGDLPFLLSLFISVVVLSALLTYPVMPLATKLLRNWLYPKK